MNTESIIRSKEPRLLRGGLSILHYPKGKPRLTAELPFSHALQSTANDTHVNKQYVRPDRWLPDEHGRWA